MEEISVARSARPYFEPGASPEPLDERVCRVALARAGRLDLVGDEGTLHVGTGNAFWQVELVRDGSGALVALAGDHYLETFDDETDLDLLYGSVRAVAGQLGARAWVGDRSLSAAEVLWRTGDGPVPDEQGPRRRWWQRR